MKKKLRKIWIIFDIENWLWKSEIGIFWLLDLERMLIWQKKINEKVLFLTQLPFDVEVDEKLLNIIYISTVNCIVFSSKDEDDNYHCPEQTTSSQAAPANLLDSHFLWKKVGKI